MNGGQQALHLAFQPVQSDKALFTGITAGQAALSLFQIAGTDLHTDRHAFHFILGELPTGRVVGIVQLHPQAGSLQTGLDLSGCFQHAGLVGRHGDHYHLNGGDGGRQHQTVVIAVGHDDRADEPGGGAPRGLEGILQLVVPTGEGHIVGPGELVSEIMAGAGLEGLTVLHHALDGIGGLSAGKLLLVGLAALDYRHGQRVAAEVSIAVELLLRFCHSLLSGLVDGVALLPPEFPAAQEGAGGLFPADHGAPLVIEHGELAVGLKDAVPVVAEHGLRGGSERQPLLQLVAAAHGDPSHLRGKAVDQFAFLFQQALRDQRGHCHVLVSGLFKLPVHDPLNVFPDSVAVWTQDHKSLHAGIVDQLRLLADVRIPLGEIVLHTGDLFHFFVLCHDSSLNFIPELEANSLL